MIADLAGVQVWLATTPVDMRKSFDSLAEVVRSFLGRDPLSGHVPVPTQSRNSSRDQSRAVVAAALGRECGRA